MWFAVRASFVARRRSTPVRGRRSAPGGRAVSSLQGEALSRGMTVGVFGGSFDPVHAGHMHVAIAAMRRLGLDRIWWLVSPQNPIKNRRAEAYAERFEQVRTRVSLPGMVTSDIELRWRVQHTKALLDELKKRHPNNHFVWLMGADNLRTFHRWYLWREMLQSVPVAVISRPQDPVRARLSMAASLYRNARIRESQAKILPLKPAPAWTYLIEPLQSESSSAIRAKR